MSHLQNAVQTEVEVNGNAVGFLNRGASDAPILVQTFTHQQFLHPPRHQNTLERYSQIIAAGQKPLVVNAGANIGTGSVWFAETFPGSHLVAIEPDATNFAFLQANCTRYDADLRAAAISNRAGRGSLVDPGRGSLGFMTGEGDDFAFLSARELLDQKVAQGYVPFIFKCDIEGGEASLFASETEWLDLFDLLIVETHDWMLPGQATSQNFLKAVSQYPRDFYFWGECLFSYKNR